MERSSFATSPPQQGGVSSNGGVAAEAATVPDTLGAVVLAAGSRGAAVAMSSRQHGEVTDLSYAELGRITQEIAGGLIAIGLAGGDRVAILCSTRVDWALADFGSLLAGAVVVPIYHTNSPEECAYVLGHSEARLVFCEDPAQAAKVEPGARAPAAMLEHVVLFDGDAGDAITLAQLRGRGGETRTAGRRRPRRAVSPDDLATLVYTSGTTGPPKACLLSHANILSHRAMYRERLQLDSTQRRSTSSSRWPTCSRAWPSSCS